MIRIRRNVDGRRLWFRAVSLIRFSKSRVTRTWMFFSRFWLFICLLIGGFIHANNSNWNWSVRSNRIGFIVFISVWCSIVKLVNDLTSQFATLTDTRIHFVHARCCWCFNYMNLIVTMSVANHAKHGLAQSLESVTPVVNTFQQILKCLLRPCPVTGKVFAVFQRVLSCFSYYTTWLLKKRQVMRSPFYVLALRRYESP